MTTLKHAFNAKDMTSLALKITRGKVGIRIARTLHRRWNRRVLLNLLIGLDARYTSALLVGLYQFNRGDAQR